MFKNKHVIAALIITPILSILGYFAVDVLVAEQPHAAKQGSSYQLVARPVCRYSSGHCSMVNGEFEIDVSAEYQSDGSLQLALRSEFPLQGGKVAIVDPGQPAGTPIALVANDASQQSWAANVPVPASAESVMRVAVAAKDSLYYGESVMAFTHYETSFGEDFRRSPP